MEHTCPLTGQTLPPDRYISAKGQQQLKAAILDLPDLAAELEITITRQHSPTINHTRHNTAGLCFNIEASKASDQALKQLQLAATTATIAGLATRRHPARPGTRAQIETAAVTLYEALGNNLAGHPVAQTVTQAVLEARRIIFTAIDTRQSLVFYGICEATWEDGQQCGHELKARKNMHRIKCHGCGTWYDKQELQDYFLEKAAQHTATVKQIVNALAGGLYNLNVKESTIRTWISRGKLHPAPGETNKYRIGDVLDLAFATKK